MELERAQTEVDKFILDAEMVNSFIAYEKKKSEPGYLKSEAEAALSDPQTWGTYAAWIIGGAGFAYVKNVIIEPKYASGGECSVFCSDCRDVSRGWVSSHQTFVIGICISRMGRDSHNFAWGRKICRSQC
jgi:hypothetical protein